MSSSCIANGGEAHVNTKFNEESKKLAKSYYPFVCADKRNLARTIVDLQASFEVAFNALDDIERIGGEVESLHYAIYGLEEALSAALTELIVIRDEVHSLSIALKQSELFNLKLYDQLVNLDQETSSGIENSQEMLKASRCMTGKYLIPKTTKEALGRAWVQDGGEKSLEGNISASILTSQHGSNEFRIWQCRIQRELAHCHAEFSFFTMGLWTEEVCANFNLLEGNSNTEEIGCFGRRGSSKLESINETITKRRETALKSLFLTRHIKIDDTSTTLGLIQSKVQELGEEIFIELRIRRDGLEEARSLHKTLNDQLNKRRNQLIESLLATHQAVQTLLQMDEQNDGLVGKLIKTRPLFSELQEAVVKGNSGNEGGGEIASFQALPEILGADGWRDLLDKLKTVRLNSIRSCNASNFTSRSFGYPLPFRRRFRRL